jgi:hypothetical protein
MKTRSTTVVLMTALIALVAAACAPAPPPTRDWKVKAESITVHRGEDQDGGDEPYVIQIGFRSKLGVSGSTSTSIASQCRSMALFPNNAAPDGTTLQIPPGSADIAFPDVQNLDILDLANQTAPFEVLGTLSFVMERDGLFQGCAITDALESALLYVLRDALALLIADSPVPPTEQQIVNLIVGNIGNFISAAGSLIGAVIEGLGNPDDIIGVAAQIHLPTTGALTDLVNTAFSIGGIFSPGLEQGFIPIEGLPSELQIRVGTLSPSSVNFRFTSAAADYTYRSTVSR